MNRRASKQIILSALALYACVRTLLEWRLPFQEFPQKRKIHYFQKEKDLRCIDEIKKGFSLMPLLFSRLRGRLFFSFSPLVQKHNGLFQAQSLIDIAFIYTFI